MEPSELWALSTDDFNKWRRENDLKKLFNHFSETLPLFEDWLKEYELSVEFILNTDKPGSFFYWKYETLLFTYDEKDTGKKSYTFLTIEGKNHEKRVAKLLAQENGNYRRFKPYLLWAKLKLKSRKIIPSKYSGKLDSFRYIIKNAPDVPEACQTIISPNFMVLKLGGTKISGYNNFTNRNLDFANLDWLEVEFKEWSHSQIDIFYSSCANIKFTTAELNFTAFYGCEFDNLIIENSKLYNIDFIQCQIFKAEFNNSLLSHLQFAKSSISNFSFNRTEVNDLIYIVPIYESFQTVVGTYEAAADNFKRFRVLYQNNGHRREAADAYYNERLYEMKFNLMSTNIPQTLKLIYKNGFDYGAPLLNENFKKLRLGLSGYLSNIIWGFGEKPIRTVYSVIILTLFYSIIYYFSSITNVGGDFTNSLYLSSILFSTLGFGDYTPVQDGAFKLILSSEALVGAFFYGLFIAGYANKAKY